MLPDYSASQLINYQTYRMSSRWRQLAQTVRTEISVYRRVLQHPRTPRISRWLLGFALLYLVSPVDLIPDWFPVLGQLDDLVIVPLLIRMALKRIPADVIEECRARVTASGR